MFDKMWVFHHVSFLFILPLIPPKSDSVFLLSYSSILGRCFGIPRCYLMDTRYLIPYLCGNTCRKLDFGFRIANKLSRYLTIVFQNMCWPFLLYVLWAYEKVNSHMQTSMKIYLDYLLLFLFIFLIFLSRHKMTVSA